MPTVLLLDDHPSTLRGLTAYLSAEPDIDIAGQVHTPQQALQFMRATPVDVLVSDMNFDGNTEGIRLMLTLREINQDVRVVFYSMLDKADVVREAVVAGARAYVLKKYDGDEVYRAIQAICRNQLYYSPELVPILVQSTDTLSDEQPPPLRALTPREQQVMKYIAQGFSTRKIADLLRISESTVQSHKANLMMKLKVDSNVGIIHYAFKYGLAN